jgi:hypothetical protein
MKYLDPRNEKPAGKVIVPVVAALAGKTLGYLNNGWLSMSKMGAHMAGPLKAKYGVSEIIFYDVPRAKGPPEGLLKKVASECDAAIVGLAN